MTDLSKAAYSFFAYARSGLAAGITQADAPPAPARAPVPLTLTVKNAGTVNAPVALYGPGDVEGIDPAQVIRVEPAPGDRGFAPNLFPLIEFDRPDYPWLFSPFAPAAGRLRPWLVLVVVRRRPEVRFDPEGRPLDDPPRPLPLLEVGDPAATASVPDEELPLLADTWAWAHVQALGDVAAAAGGAAPALGTENSDHPERVISRILSPRRLLPGKDYLACLVPAFEAGRRGGLGEQAVADLQPAWSAGAKYVRLPVYHHWEFSTGPAGDFASLARRLRPIQASGVGSRPLDASSPGGGLPSAGSGLGLHGALKGAGASLGPEPQPQFRTALEGVLNAPALAATDPSRPLPLTPPLYGGLAAGRETVPSEPPPTPPTLPHPIPIPVPHPPPLPQPSPALYQPPWLRELNLDPRHRAAAALGTRVVQEQQEELMAAAWAQVGEVLRANELIRQAQLARETGRKAHSRLGRMDAGVLLAATSPAHRRIPVAVAGSPTQTLAAKAARSRLAGRFLGPALRRLTRPRGPLARRFDPLAASRFRLLQRRLNAAQVAPAPPRPIPEGAQLLPDPAVPSAADVAAANPNLDFRLNQEPDPPRFVHMDGFQQAAIAHQAALSATLALVDPAPPPALDPLVDPTSPSAVTLAAPRQTTLAALDPEATVQARMSKRLGGTPAGWVPAELALLLFTPLFPTPMFEALRRLGQDYVLPGLDRLPYDSVTGLDVNNRFVSSFMIGLNHEMNRELLWREFPADLRGTSFTQFWDVSGQVSSVTPAPDLRDIPPIHTWPPTRKLDEGAGAAARGRFVVAVRGELLRRFPGTIVYLAKSTTGTPPEPGTEELHPVFRAGLDPDVQCFGFEITSADARARPGWFVVFQQQPSEPRFGLVEASPGDPGNAPQDWELLSWGHLAASAGALNAMAYAPATAPASAVPAGATGPAWGTHAGDTAVIALQDPVRLAIHASDVVPP